MTTDHDPLLTGLATMTVPAPGRLLDKVAARWTRVPGPAGAVYVATTDLAVAGTLPGQRHDGGRVLPVVPQRPAHHPRAQARVRQPGRGGPGGLPPVSALLACMRGQPD
jgi:hypothetical protein